MNLEEGTGTEKSDAELLEKVFVSESSVEIDNGSRYVLAALILISLSFNLMMNWRN